MKYPMKRVGERGTNQWERISWKETIDTIADNLTEIYEKDPMKLVISTGGGGNPQFFGLHRFLQAFGGGNFSSRAAPSATCRACAPSPC